MPNEFKYGGPLSRPSFRAAMKKYLPPELLAYDSKSGANAPFHDLGKDKREQMLDVLINDLPNIPLIKKQALLNRHLKNKSNADRPAKNKTKHSLHMYALTLRWLAKKKANTLLLFFNLIS